MRAATKKRPPLMTPHRWIFIIVAAFLLIGTSLGLFYRTIQMPKWFADNEARQQVVEAAGLTDVEKVYRHSWEQETVIVHGFDQEEQEVYVWMTEDGKVHTIKASDSITEEAIKAALNAEKPEALIKRIQPGWLYNEPVWEVFYSVEGKPDRYYYEFYTFGSGTFIEMYKLPAKAEP